MKILYLIHDCKKGGAQVSFIDMVATLQEQMDILVVTPHKKGYVQEQLDMLNIEHKGIPYFWWEIGLTGSKGVDKLRLAIYKVLCHWNSVAAKKIARWAITNDVDVIHTNSSVLDVGAKASEISDIPHIWHLRELEDFGLFPVYKKADLGSVLSQGNTTYVAISEYVKEHYLRYVSSEDIVTIYNGISDDYNYDKYVCGRGRVDEDKVLFLISGNFCESKGQTFVVDAVKRLVEDGITNFVVNMAGGGDHSEVDKKISEYGLADQIKILGLVKDMKKLRIECDVEIVASRFEAFGRVTVEAMRASNPVIGVNSGGTKELIEDGVTGLLFEHGDAEDLASKMRMMLEKSELIRGMGRHAYEWSVGRFTSEENADGMMRVYEQVCLK